jgi:proteasome lid subunit RPN8/RPN11
MTRYSVTIPPRVAAGLRRHAAATVPDECCGALIGSAAGDAIEIRTMIPLDNASRRSDRYVIDADIVLRLERQAVRAGCQLIGFYHSQPQDGTLRCWRLRDDRGGFMALTVSLLAGAA